MATVKPMILEYILPINIIKYCYTNVDLKVLKSEQIKIPVG